MAAIVGTLLMYVTYHQLTTGRRLFAMKAMLEVAKSLHFTSLVTFLEGAIAHDRETLALEVRWEATREDRSTRRGDAVSVDARIDPIVAAIETIARGHAMGPADDEEAQAARAFLEKLFPAGIGAVTQLPFEEQHERLVWMLEQFDGELADTVRTLGLGKKVTQLRPLVEEFGGELVKMKEKLTFDQVRTARHTGHENLAAAFFQVLGTYWSLDEQSTRIREALLAELNRQDRLVGESLRRTHTVNDIDPDTGVELTESEVEAEVTAA